MSDSPYLTVREAAHALAVSTKLVYRMFGKGVLAGIRVEGAVRISREGLDTYIAEHSNEADQGPPEPQPQGPSPRRRATRPGQSQSGYQFLKPR